MSGEQISPEGKKKAEEELQRLTQVRRPEIVTAIKTAREFGDLKENAEYHAARDEQGLNEARIRVLEQRLARAVITLGDDKSKVTVGCLVSFRDRGKDELKEVRVVHSLEADPGEQKISAESPVGRALLGRRRGDLATLSTPRGVKQIEILEIS